MHYTPPHRNKLTNTRTHARNIHTTNPHHTPIPQSTTSPPNPTQPHTIPTTPHNPTQPHTSQPHKTPHNTTQRYTPTFPVFMLFTACSGGEPAEEGGGAKSGRSGGESAHPQRTKKTTKRTESSQFEHTRKTTKYVMLCLCGVVCAARTSRCT